jgi:predicted RNA-binding Zn ribbon-like protein
MRSSGPPARFVADCAGLDFLNSGDPSQAGETDWMGSGERLLSWLDQARLAPRSTLQQLERDAAPRALDRAATQARELREWLRAFVAEHRGRALAGVEVSNLEPLNRILAADEKYSQVVAPDAKAAGPALQSVRRFVTPESLLWPIAEAVAKLVCEEDFTQIKLCEGCSLLFVDRTRRQARKWCSMSTCGNRAKQAAHRNRRKPPPH